MTWQDAFLAFLCFTVLGWLIADAFILRIRVRRLQRIVEGFAARIVAQSQRAEKNDLLIVTDIPGVSVELAGEVLPAMRPEETANFIRRFNVTVEDNGV